MRVLGAQADVSFLGPIAMAIGGPDFLPPMAEEFEASVFFRHRSVFDQGDPGRGPHFEYWDPGYDIEA